MSTVDKVTQLKRLLMDMMKDERGVVMPQQLVSPRSLCRLLALMSTRGHSKHLVPGQMKDKREVLMPRQN